MTWRERHARHIRSSQWRNMKADMIRLHGYQCARCGTTDALLDLHHKTYDRLGRELISDLQLLCRPCHDAVHRMRAARRGRRGCALSA